MIEPVKREDYDGSKLLALVDKINELVEEANKTHKLIYPLDPANYDG